jgi:hypothetical protein
MKRFSTKFWGLDLAGGFAAAWTVFLWIETFQMRAPGLRRLGLAAASFAGLFLLGWGLKKYFGRFFLQLAARQRTALLLFTGLFAGLLLVMIPVPVDQFFYPLAPMHVLTLSAETGALEKVEILQFNTAAGELDPRQSFDVSGDRLVWRGKVGGKAALAFKPVDPPLRLKVDWDGRSQSVDLSAADNRQTVFVNQFFPIPWPHRFLWLVSAWAALASLVFAVLLGLASLRLRPAQGRLSWLWYTLPMLAVWGVYWLTFWPGLLSPDSIMQWGEVQSGQFSDAHPAIHTLFFWLLSRLWNAPAVLVLFHLLLLSLLTAWGLGELQKRGVSSWVLWPAAGLFALFPINGLLVISVWKDITYACALFAFFLQFVKIYFSGGAWLKNNWNLAGLILAGLTTALVRHNGLPVVLASLLVLVFVYRGTWRRSLITAVILLLLWSGIRGPLYSVLNVKLYPGFTNILFLDHIDAHLHAGTALRPDEKAFLETLLPLSAWPYNCADSDIRKMDGPIPFDYFTQSTGEPARIALNLFLRAPQVDVEHTLCAGSIVWKINTGHYISVVSLGQNPDKTYNWVVENDLGVVEHSFLPGLLPVLANPFSDKDLLAKPAVYLLAALLILTGLALRARTPRLLVMAAPLVFQTGVMFFVTYAQDFRYFYATVLMALFCLPMLFLPFPAPEREAVNSLPDNPQNLTAKQRSALSF